MSRFPLAVILGVALLVAGCASPTIGVRSASIESSTPESVRVSVEIELANPADDTMRLLQWNYTFRSGDATYQGMWEALEALPPGNVPMLARIPCVVPAPDFEPARPWTISGSLSYRSPARVSEILYDAGLVRPSASFSGGGEAVTGANAPPTALRPTPPSDSSGS